MARRGDAIHQHGPRRFNGELLDIASASQLLGCSEKSLRARVARQCVPFRRFSGRIVFRRIELEQFIEQLPGVTVQQAQANLAARHK
jgi:hypothetical protein